MAARYVGLDSHLILRTSRAVVDRDPGLVGNLLVDRLVGAQLHLVTKEEYTRLGQRRLVQTLARELEAQGGRPYAIPVGGSNAVGTWGYLAFAEELGAQIRGRGFTDIVLATGSGSTAAGVALGNRLGGLGLRVHAYTVSDTEDYFYDAIDAILGELWAQGDADARALLRVRCAKGAGYAISSPDELATVRDVSAATGEGHGGGVVGMGLSVAASWVPEVDMLRSLHIIYSLSPSGVIMDPVYTGKALHGWLQDVRREPEAWRGRKVIFLHSGGLLGMYDKADELQGLVAGQGNVHRLQVDAA